MTKEIPVHIYLVLDRSGSMEPIKQDVIGGFNAFLADQKKHLGRCRLSMIQFDTGNPADVLYDGVSLERVTPLTERRYVPRGGTPLLDAEGWMISRARRRESRRRDAGKEDEAVIFVTLTDGMENSSEEWCYDALSKVKAAAEADGWAFMYLGVGHDAYAQSDLIGTSRASTRSYGRGEMDAALGEMSEATARYRARSRGGQRTTSEKLFENDR